MKRFLVIFIAISLAIVLTSCGSSSQSEPDATGASSTESGAESLSMDESDDSGETLDVSGEVVSVDGSIVTVETEDGDEMAFDISEAEIDGAAYIMRGSMADVTYEDTGSDVYKALYYSVAMDIEQEANIENRDPVIYGTIESMDENEIVILDDTETERRFNNQMSRTIAFEDLKVGDYIAICYYGTIFNYLEDEGEEYTSGTFTDLPVAFKLIGLDAVNTEDALANYVEGTVSSVYADSVEITNELTSFIFAADSSLLSGIEEEDRVRVYYEGAFGGIQTTASRIELVE